MKKVVKISDIQEGLKAMNSQDIARIGYKAKRETEAFINHYLNDRAKGWPMLCRCSSAYNGYYQRESAGRPGILKNLQTN
jgi:predicted nucleotidyltransferase